MDKNKAIKCLMSISTIEGYIVGMTSIKRPSIVFDNIDIIIEELMKVINNDEK